MASYDPNKFVTNLRKAFPTSGTSGSQPPGSSANQPSGASGNQSSSASGSQSSSASGNQSKPAIDYTREVRFAVVMYGGVSLAIYINGIAQELLRWVRSTAEQSDDKIALLPSNTSTADDN